MKRLFRVFTSRILWSFLGIVALICLIWFFGPLISVGEYKPLESKWVRLLLCLLIVFFFVGRYIYRKYKEIKRNERLLAELKANEQEPLIKSDESNDQISQQFDNLTNLLKSKAATGVVGKISHLFKGDKYLYQMPWYVLLGPSGVGKTTAILNSGVNFPLGLNEGRTTSKLAGTRDCDWLLSDDALFLDTAGRFVSQEGNEKQNSKDWKHFIGLLKKFRPKQPVSGLILTVSVDDVLERNKNESSIQALDIRKRIQEIREDTNANFPIYLLINKMDLLVGFEEFFSYLSDEERKNILGFEIPLSLSVNDKDFSKFVEKELNRIKALLDGLLLTAVEKLGEEEKIARAFGFPEQYELFAQKLLEFLAEIFKLSKFEQEVLWRGIYFSSATQQDSATKIDVVSDLFASNLGLQNKYFGKDDETLSSKKKSYFLFNLFDNAILKDIALAGENIKWVRKKNIIYIFILITLFISLFGLLLLLINSYFKNSAYLQDVNSNVLSVKDDISQLTSTPNLSETLLLAERVRRTAETAKIIDTDNPPFSYRYGLYQGKLAQKKSHSTYMRLLDENVVPTLSIELETELNDIILTNNADRIAVFNALKAYLMLFDSSKFEADFLRNWLAKRVSSQGILNEAEMVYFDHALASLLNEKKFTASIPYNEQLVNDARQYISSYDSATFLYEKVKDELQSEDFSAITPVSFSSMTGTQGHLVFSRISGLPLTQEFPKLFTKEGYNKIFLPYVMKQAGNVYDDEQWVLGGYSSLTGRQQAEMLLSVKQLYLEEYIIVWDEMLKDLHIRNPKSLRESIEISRLISEKQSPLYNLIKGISYNTKLGKEVQIDTSLVPNVLRPNNRLVNAVIDNEQVQNTVSESLEESALLEASVVDNYFSVYHMLTKAENNQESRLDRIIDTLSEYYVYLTAVDMSISKGVTPPSEEALINYLAEINRLPEAFRLIMDVYVSDTLSNIKDGRNSQFNSAYSEKLIPAQKVCAQIKRSGYPFLGNSIQETSIEEFSSVFGPNGIFETTYKTIQNSNSSPGSGMLGGLPDASELVQANFAIVRAAKQIQETYFNGDSNSPKVLFSIKAISLDADIDNITIMLGNKKYVYEHGPIIPENFEWTFKDENAVASVHITPNKNIVNKSFTYKGQWAPFRLFEQKASIQEIAGSNRVIVVFDFEGRKAKFEIISNAKYNPFNTKVLRNIPC